MSILNETPEERDLLSRLRKYREEADEYFQTYKDLYDDCYSYWMNIQKPQAFPVYNSWNKYNLLQVITQTKLPILVQDDPTISFIPYDMGGAEEDAAKMLTKLVGSYVWNKEKALMKLGEAAEDAMVYGVGWWKVFWDANKYVNGEKIGDVSILSIDPYAIREDPAAERIEDCRYIIHLAAMPADMVKKVWPELGEDFKGQDDVDDILGEYRFTGERPKQTGIFQRFISKFQGGKEIKRCLVEEFWLSPDEEPPNGRIITVINRKYIVDNKECPYKHRKPPYIPFVVNRKPHCIRGTGDLEMNIPLQDALNHLLQQQDEIMNRMINPTWRISPSGIQPGTKDKLKKSLNKIGAMITAEPGAVEQFRASSVPPEIPQTISLFESMILRTSGITNVIMGEGNSQHRTSQGLERLWEAGTSRIGMSTKELSWSIKEAAFIIGSIIQQYYKENRKITIVGDDNYARDNFVVTPGSLEGNYEIAIEQSNTLPQDKLSRAKLTMDLNNQGVFVAVASQDPAAARAARMVLDAVEFPGRNKLYQDVQQIKQQTQPQAPQQQNIDQAAQEGLNEMAQAGGVNPQDIIKMIGGANEKVQ